MSYQSLAAKLSNDTIDNIVDHFALDEIKGADDGPYMSLVSHAPMAQGVIGHVRVFVGKPLEKLVTCSIVVPQIMLDSHMLFAFSESDTAIPHFTFDSVKAGEHYAFHLDLTPRVDLAEFTDYMNNVYQPLTDIFNAAEAIESITSAQISPRQRAIMSPWMLVHRADEVGFKALVPYLDDYLKHWYALHREGVACPLTSERLAQRDKANRAAIFSPEIDPVWPRIQGIIGPDAVEQLRALLKGGDVNVDV
ncbi:hypothetical protein [Thalassotalea maritima]|uniref:hypothetical protein n=1 Tax=Thalassotalea maritima TaxID=3242416 RepID=UPI0035284DDA